MTKHKQITMKNLSVFTFLEMVKPFNPEATDEVFVTFLQLGFEDVWFNMTEQDFNELRNSRLVSFGWTRNADQALIGNSTQDNF